MDKLEPLPREGQGRTWVSYLFPNSDLDIARRAKFLDEEDQREIKYNVLEGKESSFCESSPEGAPSKPIVVEDSLVVDQINGTYLEEEVKPEPKTLGWIGAFWSMIAYSIALGILSIPLVVATIGIVPFILIAFFFAGLSYYNGYQYWRLSLLYPNVHSMQQAGEIMFGPWGRVLFGTIQIVFSTFLQGNHALLGGYAFWELGWHSCMVGLVAAFAAISFIFTLPRSYKLFAWEAGVSFTSIFTVVVITMIASGITGPDKKPEDPPKRLLAFGSAPEIDNSFLSGVSGVCNVFVSFGAMPSYLPLMSEMRDRRLFMRSLSALIVISTIMYVIVGCIINYNLGQYTASPSLESLSPVMVKVTYGLGLPTIMVAGCASGQVNGKVLMRIVFNGPRRRFLKSPTISWTAWILINLVTWTCAFILAELVPFFSAFLSLEASLFWAFFLFLAPLFSIWRHQHDYWSNMRNRIGFFFAIAVTCVSTFLCIVGIWSAGTSIRDQYNMGTVGSPFSCSKAETL